MWVNIWGKVQSVYIVTFLRTSPNYVCQFTTDPQIIFSLLLPAVDHSRVKLENADNDYINASLVVMEEAQRSYILTQASQRLFIPVILVMPILWINGVIVWSIKWF